MKKVVLKLDLHDESAKKKAMKSVSGLEGLESISMDMKDKKLTVTGDIDTVNLVSKLRKLCRTEIVSVGPAKEESKKGDDAKKKEDPKDEYLKFYNQYYNAYSHPPNSTYYYVRSAEEDPNACVIC